MRKVLVEHKYQVIMLKDINLDKSSHLKLDWKSPCPWFDSASGHQFQKKTPAKAGFFMSKVFSKLPFKEFSLSTDINW